MNEMDINNTISKSIDWSLCLTLANNKPNLAKEMLTMFVEELPKARFDINQAYQAQDYRNLHMNVHRLHGASCYCGVPKLKSILVALESKTKSASKNEIFELIKNLNQEIESVLLEYTNNYKNL